MHWGGELGLMSRRARFVEGGVCGGRCLVGEAGVWLQSQIGRKFRGLKMSWSMSAPHFGPSASHTRILDRSPGHYSSPSHQRQISGRGVMNNGRKAGSLRKAEEGHQKNLRVKNPENDGAGTVALFITESPKHRKVPNMGLQKSLSVPK
ncbi:hypothetical protein CDL15_Pgr014213 [Punica granatum]|uniref:Uncharacterized protein n=1 Tax=Punica granatum TaxID=22663 RepID=A0A218WX28_PUNGR|nr:hypothetical protein CDL15_Pgr014213 [Punica granatum]